MVVEVDLKKVVLVGGFLGLLVAWWLRSIWREDLDAFTSSGQ